ncbi:MAG: alanine--tRNA ligase-related protein [Nanoarchaeota archaeon]
MPYDEQLYLHDAYAKEFDATVISVKDGKYVVLDRTLFYPGTGGQANDTGTLTTEDGREYQVVFVGKFSGAISHEVDAGENGPLKEGDKVHGIIDWERRYRLMRSHTAAHVVSGVIAKELGAHIHGNQKSPEKVRIDFDTENFDKEYMRELVGKSNEIIRQGLAVKTYFITKKSLDQNPDMMKLAKGLPEGVTDVRIVEIEGFDKQPCGGTHVKNLSEIGDIAFKKAENRGKTNRRLYFTLSS